MIDFSERFWKLIALMIVFLVGYAAHGLTRGNIQPSSTVIRSAEGGQLLQYSAKLIVTVSEDGEKIIFWNLGGTENGIPKLEAVRKYQYTGKR